MSGALSLAQPLFTWRTPTGLLIILLGISFHVLATPDFAGNAVRLGASDLILPIGLAGALSAWLRKEVNFSHTLAPYLWLWLAALSFWILTAFLVGRLHTGEWLVWGVLNKGIGWLVLVGYFMTGFWLGQMSSQALATMFFRVFLVAGWTASFVSILLFFLDRYGLTLPVQQPYIRVQGLFGNPNAFGIAVAAQICVQAPFAKTVISSRRTFIASVLR